VLKTTTSRTAPAPTQKAFGHWLHAYEWNHFVTATCETERSVAIITRHFVNGFVRRAAFEAHGFVAWFAVIEKGKGGRLHVHALVGGTGLVSGAQLGRCWKLGNCHAVEYDPALGAAYYVTKDVQDRALWWDVSRKWLPLAGRPVTYADTAESTSGAD
jgi:hypothetical protein